MQMKRKEGTKTSSFGSPGRVGHDSSTFYKSRLYEGLPTEKEGVVFLENKVDDNNINKIF